MSDGQGELLDPAVYERTDRSIKEIASTTGGFADAFHFSRVFARTFACAPPRYRDDFRRGRMRRLATPTFERITAQYIVWCMTSPFEANGPAPA